MSISISDVRYIAALARLSFSSEEEFELTDQMNTVLEYMDKLNELDTSAVPPMSHVLSVQNVYRLDHAEQRISHDEAMKNAPDADSDYFRVPKVIS